MFELIEFTFLSLFLMDPVKLSFPLLKNKNENKKNKHISLYRIGTVAF